MSNVNDLVKIWDDVYDVAEHWPPLGAGVGQARLAMLRAVDAHIRAELAKVTFR